MIIWKTQGLKFLEVFSIFRCSPPQDVLSCLDYTFHGMGGKVARRSFQQLGLEAVGDGDYATAEALFRQAIDQDRGNWLAYVWLSVSLDCRGNPTKASSVLVDFCCTLDLFGGHHQAAAIFDSRLEKVEGGGTTEPVTLVPWLTLYRAMVSRFCCPRILSGVTVSGAVPRLLDRNAVLPSAPTGRTGRGRVGRTGCPPAGGTRRG